jgi:hypothetical protein
MRVREKESERYEREREGENVCVCVCVRSGLLGKVCVPCVGDNSLTLPLLLSLSLSLFLSLVRSGFLENYACLALETIRRPGVYFCGENSVDTVRGAVCRGDWDYRTCSRIARGEVQPGEKYSDTQYEKERDCLLIFAHLLQVARIVR